MGSFLWPISALLLTCAVTLPCLALVFEERTKRILNAFASLFNAFLASYLGLIPLVREGNTRVVAIFSLALATSLAAAVSAVILAFFGGRREVAASDLIQLLVGPVQNYTFTTVLGAYNSAGDDCRIRICRQRHCRELWVDAEEQILERKH